MIHIWVQTMGMFSGSRTLDAVREYVYNWNQNKPSSFQSVCDPELLIILRRTIQIHMIDITRTMDFTYTGTFQRVAVNELTQLETRHDFPSRQHPFWWGRQQNGSVSETPLWCETRGWLAMSRMELTSYYLVEMEVPKTQLEFWWVIIIKSE